MNHLFKWLLKKVRYCIRCNVDQTRINYLLYLFYYNVYSLSSVNISFLGKEEEKMKLDAALNSVAAQVYDNLNEQLKSMQNKQLEEAERLSNELKSRLRQPKELLLSCKNVMRSHCN